MEIRVKGSSSHPVSFCINLNSKEPSSIYKPVKGNNSFTTGSICCLFIETVSQN